MITAKWISMENQRLARSCLTSPKRLMESWRFSMLFFCHHADAAPVQTECDQRRFSSEINLTLKFFTCSAGYTGQPWPASSPIGSLIISVRCSHYPGSGQRCCWPSSWQSWRLFAPDTFPTGHLLKHLQVPFNKINCKLNRYFLLPCHYRDGAG